MDFEVTGISAVGVAFFRELTEGSGSALHPAPTRIKNSNDMIKEKRILPMESIPSIIWINQIPAQ